jgi:hypothetical protein
MSKQDEQARKKLTTLIQKVASKGNADIVFYSGGIYPKG